MIFAKVLFDQIRIEHDARHRIVYLVGDSGRQSAQPGHFLRLHEHIVRLLQILFDLNDVAQISEYSKSGDLFVLVVDNAAGKPHRNLMTVLVAYTEFMIEQLALAAEFIAAHPLDDFVSQPILIETGYVQSSQAGIVMITKQCQGGIVEEDQFAVHIGGDDPVNR